MKRIKVVIFTCLLTLSLVGCSTSKKEKNNTYTDTYQLQYFYVETCARCKEFEDEVLPMIEKEFGDHMEIILYNLDKSETKEVYDGVLDNIIGFDVEEDYGYGPFIVLDGYFAKLGMTSGDGEEFIDDLIRAVTNQPLGDELSNNRYLFVDGKIKE